LSGALRRLRPGFGREIFDLPVGHRRQAGEDVPEIGERIEAAPPAAFDDGVDDGAAVARLGFTDEEPVLLADGGGPDGVFVEVVIDLQSASASFTTACKRSSNARDTARRR